MNNPYIRKKRFDDGGWIANNASSITSGANFAGDAINAIAPSSGFSDYAGGALKGAASGAAMGSIFGPPGIVIGAGVGLVSGLISGIGKHKSEQIAKQQQLSAQNAARIQKQKSYETSILNNYNQLGNNKMYGYYGLGGRIRKLHGMATRMVDQEPMEVNSMVHTQWYPKKHYDFGGPIDTLGKRKPVMVDSSTSFPPPGDPYWKAHPLVTEHADGTLRQWGEDTLAHKPIPPTPLPVLPLGVPLPFAGKPPLLPSDKSLGYSSYYYPSNMQRVTPSPTRPAGYDEGGYLPEFASGGGIHIKPENKGKFNATKKATGKTTEELTHSSNPVTRKRAIFAQNAAKWHHAYGGYLSPENEGEPIEGLISPFHTGNIIKNGRSYADGGELQSIQQQGAATPLASGIQQFNGPSHAQGGIDLDTNGDGQAEAEVEGNEVQSGDQIFSDRLAPSPMMQNYLKQNKVNPEGSYAEIAARLGKKKGKFEAKMKEHSPVSLRTGKAMNDRIEQVMEALFQDQEQSKAPQAPQFAYGGRLPQYADGGTLDDPRNKAKQAQLQKQLDAFDAHYKILQDQANQAGISSAKQRKIQGNLAALKEARDRIAKGMSDYGGYYAQGQKSLESSLKHYDPNAKFSNWMNNTQNPNDINKTIKGYSDKIDNGLEMLKRLQTVDPNTMDGNWEQKVGLKRNSDNYNALHNNETGYYPYSLDSSYKPTATATTSATAIKPSTTSTVPPPTSTNLSTPRVSTNRGTGRTSIKPNYGSRTASIDMPNNPAMPANDTLIPSSGFDPDSRVHDVAFANEYKPGAPSSTSGTWDKIGKGIKDYGADALNFASYIGNQTRINKMQAPTFDYVPAPQFNYTDRSGLNKYENDVASKAAMAGVTNTSGQGQQAQRGQIFAQQLNANNQINNQENMRRDSYVDNYNNRVLQTQYTNTDIANRQADVTSQVYNDKIAMGIQNQNSFFQGEITNQNTRDQQDLDQKKAMMIMMGTQDPAKLAQYMGDPETLRKLKLFIRNSYSGQ